MTGRTLALLALLSVFGAASVAATVPLAAQENSGDDVVIVLEDGTEIRGKILEETDEAVVIKSAFGRSTIERSRIKEIRRGESPHRAEFDDRFGRASRRKDAGELFELARWARGKGLLVECRRALFKVIEIDPDYADARRDLGHARLDGKWVDEDKVQEMEAKGYVVRGLDLVRVKKPAPSESGKPAASGEKKYAKKLSQSELRKLEREREKRKRLAEKFREAKEAEFRGVPWEDRHIIKTPHYTIICDSTRRVAETYHWIMENLFDALSRRFTGKPQHRQRSPVTIYKNHETFMEKTGMPRGVGGFYNRGNKGIWAYHGTFGLTSTTFNVLAHEGTHQFQGRMLKNMGNFPIWLIEGMAVYFGDGSRLDRKKKRIVTGLIPRDRLFHIQEKMQNGTHTKLRTLISMGRNRFGGSQYADSWALVYYFFDGPERSKGLAFMSEYWNLGQERDVTPNDFRELAERYFGGMSELENAWLEHMLALKPEPAGEVEGDYFVSDEFKFEVKRPSERWEFLLDQDSANKLVALEVPDTSAEIEIRFLNKNDQEQAPAEWMSEQATKIKEKYDEYGQEEVQISYEKAFKLTYQDRGYGLDDDGKQDGKENEKEKGKDAEGGKGDEKDGKDGDGEPVDLVQKKYRAYVIVGVKQAYWIVGSCEIAEFPEFEADFDRLSKDFELILGNRW